MRDEQLYAHVKHGASTLLITSRTLRPAASRLRCSDSRITWKSMDVQGLRSADKDCSLAACRHSGSKSVAYTSHKSSAQVRSEQRLTMCQKNRTYMITADRFLYLNMTAWTCHRRLVDPFLVRLILFIPCYQSCNVGFAVAAFDLFPLGRPGRQLHILQHERLSRRERTIADGAMPENGA